MMMYMRALGLAAAAVVWPGLLGLGAWAVEGEVLHQDLGNGDVLLVDDPQQALPRLIVQSSPRRFTRDAYMSAYRDVGLHVYGGADLVFRGIVQAADDDACTVIGVRGQGSVLRFAGTWQSDGIYNFPHLLLLEGGRFVFTSEAVMDLVMERDYFTRQLWVYGDGSGVLELESGFVADHSIAAPVPRALGTIRLGGATLITHHTRSLPSHTRPDGRGGTYQNGHIVFERLAGNRWIVDTSNQVYRAQIDIATDAIIETRANLIHAGHRQQALPLPAGVYFTSSGAFRTMDSGLVITKTGPAMLALDGEQSYHPDTELVIDEGLVRMSTDPGLGRAHAAAGPYLRIRLRASGRWHVGSAHAALHEVRMEDRSQAWIDEGVQLHLDQPLAATAGTVLHVGGTIHQSVISAGRLHINSHRGASRISADLTAGGLDVTVHHGAASPMLRVDGHARISQDLAFRVSNHRRGLPASGLVLLEAEEISGWPDGASRQLRCADDRVDVVVRRDGGRLLVEHDRP